VGILANFHWADIEIYMHGARLTNISLGANGPGLYTMSAIIGLLTLGFPGILHIHGRRRRYALFVLAAVVLAVMGVVFVWNQARSAWVGAAVVLPVVTVALIRQPSSRRVGMIMGAALVLLAVVVLANADIVAQRLDQEHHVMKMLAEGNIADVPYETAIGERVHIWEEGVRRVTMRPLFGWGPGTAGILSRQPGVVTARPFEHFHDIFLQIWVELGLVGLILFVSVWVLMAGKLVRAYRSGWAPPGYAFFAGGVLALFTMVTLVDIRHDDGHGMFFVVFLGGLLLVHWLRRARRSGVIAAAPASPKDAQEPGGLPGRAGGPCEPCNAAQGRLRPTQRCLTMSCARWAME
jgi:O-antigen ligase